MTGKEGRSLGIVLFMVGALLLIAQFVDVDITAFTWPLFVLIPGALLFTWAVLARGQAAPLAIPGSIVTMIGLILFTQNVTGHFESWAYAWGLILLAVGFGIALTGSLQANAKMQKEGRQLATLGLGLFVAFGAFFELLIFRNFVDTFWWRYVLPLALMGGGLLLLRSGQAKREQADGEAGRPKERADA